MKLAHLVAAALYLATPVPAAELEPVPRPDLSAMERAIQLQIDGMWELLEERSSEPLPVVGQAYGTLGQLYHLYGMSESAAACYHNAGLLAPEDLRWPYYLAVLHTAAGDTEAAARRLRQVLERAPDHLPSLIRIGELHLAGDRPEEAAKIFRRGLGVDAEAAAAHYGVGKAAATLGDHAAAVGHFEKVLELQPDASIVHVPLALSLRRLGQNERSRAHLEQRGLREVDVADPMLARLDEMSTLAAFQLVRALAAKDQGFSAAELLGYTLSLLARVEGAAEELERLLADWPRDRLVVDTAERARLHYAAGALRVHRAQEEQASRHFRTALALAPDLLDARIKLANIEARRGAWAETVAQLSIVLERDAGRSEARLKRAAALLSMRRPREAARDLERLEVAEPNNPEVRYRLAVALEQLGRFEEAFDSYLAAAGLEPVVEQQALAHYRAGGMALRLGDPESARRHYLRALELRPDFPSAERELAALVAESGGESD